MHKPAIVTVALIATASLFAMTPGVVSAQTAPRSVAVEFRDLDLATDKGQRTLERRIVRAARTVCGLDDQTTGTRLASPESTDCYRQALRNVRERVASAIANGERGG
jgi:UrcA family protein